MIYQRRFRLPIFATLSRHFQSRYLSRTTKMKIFKILFCPVLTYSQESWAFTKKDDLATFIRIGRLRWAGQVPRMDKGESLNNYRHFTIQGGRTKVRQLDNMEVEEHFKNNRNCKKLSMQEPGGSKINLLLQRTIKFKILLQHRLNLSRRS